MDALGLAKQSPTRRPAAKSRKLGSWLVILAIPALCLTALVGYSCASETVLTTGSPKDPTPRPPTSSHWTQQLAFECEYELDASFGNFNIAISEGSNSPELELGLHEKFAFRWDDEGRPPMLLHCVVVREDQSATVFRRVSREEQRDGQTVIASDYHRADFKLTDGQYDHLRTLIRSADLGSARRHYSRMGIYDGAWWDMYLRVGKEMKHVSFSNAFPERFRHIVGETLRWICGMHTREIDASKKMEGWPEFAFKDVIPE